MSLYGTISYDVHDPLKPSACTGACVWLPYTRRCLFPPPVLAELKMTQRYYCITNDAHFDHHARPVGRSTVFLIVFLNVKHSVRFACGSRPLTSSCFALMIDY